MKTLKKIFGSSTHLELVLLYYNNPEYFANISQLAKKLDKSHITVRKAISDLEAAGILTELNIGKSHVIKINENSEYTEILFNFIDTMQSEKERSGIKEIIAKRKSKSEKYLF